MFSNGFINLTWEELCDTIGQGNILAHYFGITYLPCVINSPLREDKNPSFGLRYLNGNIVFKDFSSGESGSLLTLLKRYFNITRLELINKIYLDFQLSNTINILNYSISKVKITQKAEKINFKIKVRVKKWRDEDFEFWKLFGIDKEWLTFGSIYPISHIFITKGDYEYIIPAEKYAYAYIENKDNNISVKVYQPFSENYKWINSHDRSVWDLWGKLPPSGDKLIITSSRKDSLCTWANTGIPCTNLQAESYLPKEQVINELKSRFSTVFVLYDNDFTKETNVGRVCGEKIALLYSLKQIEIPEKLKSKDPSDLYKNHGVIIFKEALNQLINN